METMDRGSYFLWVVLIGVARWMSEALIALNASPYGDAGTVIFIIVLLGSLAAHVVIATYRCVDIGINKLWALVMLVPLVNLFAMFYFLLRRGNAYYMHVKSKEAGNE